MERPWKVIPKTPFDELNDGLFKLPSIFEALDRLRREPNHDGLQDCFHDIIGRFLEVGSFLQGLCENFKRSVSGPFYWPEMSTLESSLDSTEMGKVFPVSFHFPAFVVAHFTVMYWSGMMTVHNQLMYTYDALAAIESAPTSVASSPGRSTAPGSGCSPSVLQSREHKTKWEEMARNICQSAEYFLQDNMGEFGSLSMLALLSGANSCMMNASHEWSREIIWIAELLGRLKKKSNLPSSDLLKEYTA